MSWTSFLISFTSLSSELFDHSYNHSFELCKSFYVISTRGHYDGNCIFFFSRGDMLFGFSLFSELRFAHLEFVG